MPEAQARQRSSKLHAQHVTAAPGTPGMPGGGKHRDLVRVGLVGDGHHRRDASGLADLVSQTRGDVQLGRFRT